MMLLEALPLALLAAVVGLDVVSFPQAMISRPLVAASLGGAMAGRVEDGLLAGVLLELLALETLPVGASRYPEWGSASVVGGALAAEFASRTPAALPMATLLGLATALGGGWSMIQLRKLNARWARTRLDALQRGSYRTVVGLQLYGMTADLLRGGLVAIVALLVGRPLTEAVAGLWTVSPRVSSAVVVATSATVAVAALWKRAHAAEDARWYLVSGLLAGGALLWLW
jgi:PTS system mannose-specific IIC component